MSSSKLVLAETFGARPSVEFEVVREVAPDPECPAMFGWVTCGDYAAFEEAMDDDPTVASYTRFGENDTAVFYRIQTSESTDLITYPKWVSLSAEKLSERYCDGKWHTQMRYPDSAALHSFQQWCADNGVEFGLESVYASDPTRSGVLTDQQREVMRVALEVGFFDIPRGATMADVADDLGVSEQAVSERLRRATKALARRYVST
jgi:predicted DNA binding protein